MTKDELRHMFLSRRDDIPASERELFSKRIAQRVFGLEEYRTAENVLIYASMRSEVITDDIILDALGCDKKVFCPKVTDPRNGIMKFVHIQELSDLKKGYFGIREPEISEDYEEPCFDPGMSLVIMPGVAFDDRRNRIGYSGGFYDRFLAENRGLKTLALCFECQMSGSELPAMAHDVRPDVIITENGIY